MGLDPRPATDDELAAMQRLVREGMDAGAVGLSTGLDYIPSLLRRRPRDRRALRGDRRRRTASTSPTCGATARTPPIGMREVYEIARLSGVAGPRLALQRPGRPPAAADRPGPGAGARPDLRHLSLPGRQHDPGHGRPAGLGPGGRDRRDRSSGWRDPAVRARLKRRVVLAADALSRSTRSRSRWSPNPDWRWAEGLTRRRGGRAGEARRRATSSARSCSASGMAVGIVGVPRRRAGPRPTSARSSGTRRTWRAPTASSAAASRTRAAGAPSPATSATTPAQLGDYTWAEAVTHLATHAARRFRLTDRGLIRPGYRRRHRRLRPGHRDRPLDLRRRPDARRGRRPRPRQRHARPRGRRADRRHARPGAAAGMTPASPRE